MISHFQASLDGYHPKRVEKRKLANFYKPACHENPFQHLDMTQIVNADTDAKSIGSQTYYLQP